MDTIETKARHANERLALERKQSGERFDLMAEHNEAKQAMAARHRAELADAKRGTLMSTKGGELMAVYNTAVAKNAEAVRAGCPRNLAEEGNVEALAKLREGFAKLGLPCPVDN